MKQKTHQIAFIVCILSVTPLTVQANVPVQKFYPLERKAVTQQEQDATRKFIPLQRRSGRPLVFKASGAQAIKNQNHESLPMVNPKQNLEPVHRVRSDEKVSEGNASQLLSIYEPVD